MKFAQLPAFEKHLADATPTHLLPIYLILGKEAFSCKEAALKTQKALLGNREPEHSLRSFEGNKSSAKAIIQELNSPSFLVDRIVVVVHAFDKLRKDDQEKLLSYLNAPTPGSYLVLVGETLAANTKLYKKVEELGAILRFEEEKAWAKAKSTAAWLPQAAAKTGKRFAPAALNALMEHIGHDKAFLTLELEKLACYAGKRPEVSLEDVKALCMPHNQEDEWQLGSAVMRLDGAKALRLGLDLLSDGVSLFPLLTMLRRQLETDFQVCSLLAQGEGAPAITKTFPYMRGKILDQHIHAAQTYGADRFKRALIDLDATHLQAKNSALSPELLLSKLLARLTT